MGADGRITGMWSIKPLRIPRRQYSMAGLILLMKRLSNCGFI